MGGWWRGMNELFLECRHFRYAFHSGARSISAMRLFYVANIRLPTEKAHGIQIMEMCSAFARAGVAVSLIVPTRRNQSLQNVDPFEYYGVEKNFEIRYIPSCDPVWLMRVPGGIYYKVQSYLYGRRVRHELSSVIRPDDILYSRDELMLPSIVRLSHNAVWEAHTLLRRYYAFSWVWRRLRNIIVITQALKNELTVALRPFGVNPQNMLVVSDGVDLKKYDRQYRADSARRLLHLPVDKKIVMYTGQLFEWKGADVLLEAARHVQRSTFNVQREHAISDPSFDILFVFVGGMDEDVKRLNMRAAGLENVLILGHRPHNELSLYQKAADVLVLPNKKGSGISERWTSPLKLFEYMASGAPIVASDLPSLREVLNESNAVLVEPNNARALVQGIQHVLTDENLAKRISAKACEDARAFSWDKRAERILTELR